MVTITYKLKYLSDQDDMDPKTLVTTQRYSAGDVIQPHGDWGFFHLVTQVRELKTGAQLVLSESAQSAQVARLQAVQLGHWPAA